ncbi:MAG: MurR/RpiR family transcriptional regulator [Desulfobulbaceae bacterium]|nr:MurR/RpiR family transcriptional regulator [Desulfobulbaceae bacterium]
MESDNLLYRIRNLGKLTRSEAKIANYLEKNYPLTAFETIVSISEKADVGKATVGRFIKKLGYDGFLGFMSSVRRDVVTRLETPIEQYLQKKDTVTSADTDFFRQHISFAIENFNETYARLDKKQFDAAAEILAKCPGKLYITGAATSQALANYFYLLVCYLREDAKFIDCNISTLAHRLADVSSEDVLFAITHYRFSAVTENIVHWFKQKGCKVILLSDREVNPVADIVDIQMVTRSDTPLMFNSRCATFLLLETLISAMTPLLDPQVFNRFQSFDIFFKKLSVFSSTIPPDKPE